MSYTRFLSGCIARRMKQNQFRPNGFYTRKVHRGKYQNYIRSHAVHRRKKYSRVITNDRFWKGQKNRGILIVNWRRGTLSEEISSIPMYSSNSQIFRIDSNSLKFSSFFFFCLTRVKILCTGIESTHFLKLKTLFENEMSD